MLDILIPDFDEPSHSLTLNGRKCPSVTGIINAAIGVNPFWTKEGREAGKQLHKAIEIASQYYAEGDLDMDNLDPHLVAYFKFREETGFKPDLTEQPMAHKTYGYAGIPDQVQIGRCVVDFKKGQHLPQHALQLAAYAHMLPNPLLYERWTVQLLPTGKYKLEPYPKQQMTADFQVFLSALNIHNWRKNVRC